MDIKLDRLETETQSCIGNGGLMDSAWPMYCHDVRHTGRSPYSIADNPGTEKWRFDITDDALGSPVIDKDGIIYIGSHDFYAIYPNSTLKWKYDKPHIIYSAGAIDEANGVLSVGTYYANPNYLYAFYLNATIKWKYKTGDDIYSSPAIGDDGTIYFGTGGDYPWYGHINALYPNGTLKWRYETGYEVYSSPAIGDDGTIYCGSHDGYLYALYPNNGTLKWKFRTGDWVGRGPSIADDGTIYFGSWDGYLYALYPNGTLKWKTGGYLAGTTPITGADGTIYVGNKKLYAIYPENGTIKWSFNLNNEDIRGSNPCISADGTIYFGTFDGGRIYAVNNDGTEKWHRSIGGDVLSAPAIGKDGTIYIGDGKDDGSLHAFGIGELEADANGPYYGLINEPVQFNGYTEGGYPPYQFLWDFGDGNTSDEEDPVHIYKESGNFTNTLTVTDNTSNTSSDITWAWIQDGNTPPDTPDIDGPNRGNPGIIYNYKFTGTDVDDSVIYLYVDWDDGSNSGWLGPYDSGNEVTLSHKWSQRKTYIIKCKIRDPYDAESNWTEFEIKIPRNKVSYSSLFLRVLERFPLLEKLFSFMK